MFLLVESTIPDPAAWAHASPACIMKLLWNFARNVASDGPSHIVVRRVDRHPNFSFATGPEASIAGDNGTGPMLRKMSALLLVILTVLPFTAPFPTFDLTHGSHSHSTSVDDGSHALPTLAASTRMRTRFASHAETSISSLHIAVPRAPAPRSEPAAPRLFDRPSPTVLRI
jgi:hypothetical protein